MISLTIPWERWSHTAHDVLALGGPILYKATPETTAYRLGYSSRKMKLTEAEMRRMIKWEGMKNEGTLFCLPSPFPHSSKKLQFHLLPYLFQSMQWVAVLESSKALRSVLVSRALQLCTPA